jgi:predicted  nucleic acid-binding Zn-ribbon protein
MKNKTFQLKLSHLIIGGIILLLVIFLFKYNPTQDIPNNYDKQKREIDSLGNIINELKEDQLKLNQSLSIQYAKVDSLNKEITTTEKELIQTRAYYGNKIKNITSYSPSELIEFFTERYK